MSQTSSNPLSSVVVRALKVPGITEAGGAWLAKALHPSDATLKCNGIPEDTSIPTAALNFMTTQTITAPAAASWSAHIKLAPTPTVFGRTATNTAAAFGYTSAFNPTLVAGASAEFGAAGRTYAMDLTEAFASNAHAYRLMYCSVTATLAASATSNEGSVVAAQYDARPLDGFTWPRVNLNINPTLCEYTKVADYWSQNQYTGQQLQTLPGAIQWDAKRGVYMVLKLDRDAMTWHSAHQTRTLLCGSTEPAALVADPVLDRTLVTDHYTAGAATTNQPPWGVHATWGDIATIGTGATASIGADNTTAQYPPVCYNTGEILFQGLNAAASIVLTWRVGFEVIAPPLSPYATFMTAPVPQDPIAIAAYHSIAREMLAAYPAEYNILGTLFNVIKGIGSAVLPTLGNMFANKSEPATSPAYAVNPPASAAVPRDARPPQVVYVDRPINQTSRRGRRRNGRGRRNGSTLSN